ncbi:MAG: HAMP domain-containing protein [Planctomycetes bacterium]|nr:HAMP domain-containing protein [Planctomycetota bacterium]
MSWRRSFGVRIAWHAALVCGLVLSVFGLVLWNVLNDSGSERIDRGLAGIANDHFANLLPHDTHRAPSLALAFYGEEFRELAVLARQGDEVLVRSARWPELLDAAWLARLRFEGSVPLSQDLVAEFHAAHTDEEAREAMTWRPVTFATVDVAGRTYRLARVLEDDLELTLCLDLRRFTFQMHRLGHDFAVALLGAVLAAFLGCAWLARRALRPVAVLTDRAERITAHDLSQRIEETTQDREFTRLVRVVNAMLARLETSFERVTRFSADASHELRTPLTIMQGEVETALHQVEEGSDAERALTRQLEEVHRLKSLVDRLLLLARADRGALLAHRERFDLAPLIQAAVEDARILAPELSVSEDLPSEAILVEGEPGLVERAIRNLLSNACKYNHPGGAVRVRLEARETVIALEVENTGPRIEGEDRELIFDRFYRRDAARGRTVDGLGLGLGLAREIARAHGGELRLLDDRGEYTVFALELPVVGGVDA